MWASFDQSYTVLRKFWYLQNKGTSLRNFFINSALGKFRHSISSVERVTDSALERWTLSERDKLDRRRSAQLTIPPSSNARPLSFIAENVKVCLRHDFVAQVNWRQLIFLSQSENFRGIDVVLSA